MSIAEQTLLTLGRAGLIAGAAVAVSGWLAGAVRGGRWAWVLLLAPFFTPPLLVSYAYSKWALALVQSPWMHEGLYASVLALKLIPVATIVRVFVPSPLSAEARFCHRLFSKSPWRERVGFRLRGAGAGPRVAAALVFVLAFADFELASLWSMKSWTVAIFDAQAGGLALGETLRLALLPLGIEIAALSLALRVGRGFPVPAPSPKAAPRIGPVIFLIASAAVVCAVPLAIVAWQAAQGVHVLTENFVLTGELGASVLFAAAGAAAAFYLSGFARGSLMAAVPGLLGALVVSLIVLALFQVPPFRIAYDTPLPLAIALTIFLLPLAFLLRALVDRRSPGLEIARHLGSRRIVWELEKRPRLVAFGILFCWAYFDFTAAAILAPTRMTLVFVRLHNLAHYGQTSVLSAMMLAAFSVPVLLLLLTGASAQLYARRNGQ